MRGVTAPLLLVKTKNTQGGYCANHIATVIKDGKYVLSFISSGFLATVPIDEVESITLKDHAAAYCVSCDGQIYHWPMNDPSYGPETE